MRTNNITIWALLLGLGCASSDKPSAEEPQAQADYEMPPAPMESPPAVEPAAAPAAPAAGDPLVVAPTMYKQIFEDDHVRLLEVTFKPGETIGLHSHPDHLLYVVSAGKLTITPQGGAAEEVAFKKGQTVFIPATAHSAVNTGKTEVKAAVLELKPNAAWGAPAVGEDPTKTDAKTYKVIFENERARVMDVKIAKRAKTKMHAHPDHVIYVLDGGKVTFTPGDGGAPHDVDLATGQGLFAPAQAHSAQNTGTTTVKAVVFEIKK